LRYIRERGGVAPSLDQLAAQYGVEPPEINPANKTLRLSRAAASNAQIFQQAKAQAERNGQILVVDPIQEAGPGSNGR
jgi:hypothetical protein